MIKVVNIADKSLVTTYDGWVTDAYEKALKDIQASGFEYVREEISDLGDVVIWVK